MVGSETASRFVWLKWVAVGLVMCLGGGGVVFGAEVERPNIVLIIGDQHSADMMSCAGNAYLKTPALDGLAAAGVRFSRAYVTHPLCIPSRASFMTGTMPTVCGDDVVAHKSMGAYMKEAGYDTGYFGKWHIKPSSTERQAAWHGFKTIDTKGIDSEKADKSVAFIKREREAPFFMVASFLNPHDICEWARIHSGVEDEMRNGGVGPAPDASLCPPLPSNFEVPAGEPSVVRQRLVHDERARSSVHPTATWSVDDWRKYRWAYCRLVEKLDSQVGQLLAALEETGQLENTVVVYTSDHGDGNGAHRWNQKVVLYEEAIRLPLIVSWKGNTRAGVVDDGLVSMNLDLLPTFCALAGVKAEAGLLGKNLGGRVFHEGEAVEGAHDFVVTETKLFDDVQGRALMTNRMKYIVYSEGENPEQLFDLWRDPGEMKSLVDDVEYKDELRRLRRLLKGWMESIGDSL